MSIGVRRLGRPSRDLRPDWPASKKNVPITSEDPAFWPHLVQFTVGLGVSSSLHPVLSLTNLISGVSSWPVASDSSNQIDDLWHTALNSHGKYFNAKDPTEFSRGLELALGAISARVGEAATMAKSSNAIRSGTSLFVSTYRTDDWSGQLQQKILDPRTGRIADDQASTRRNHLSLERQRRTACSCRFRKTRYQQPNERMSRKKRCSNFFPALD